MKKSKQDRKLSVSTARRGIERERVMAEGGVWMRPSAVFESRVKYSRAREKNRIRKELSEH